MKVNDDDYDNDQDNFIFVFGMFVQRNMVCLISHRDHCNGSSPWQISDTPLASSGPVLNLSSGLVE